MDAEEATQLQLRKNQENKTYIFLLSTEKEELFSDDLSQLDISIEQKHHKAFIERKAPNSETLIDLYYGYPVFVDEKDMLSPLFFMEVKAEFFDANILRIIPQEKKLTINRKHFVGHYDIAETQRICEELEGEFGSFAACIKAAESYIPSLVGKKRQEWIGRPILFRTNHNSSRSGVRYDLTCLLKDDEAHTKDTALKHFIHGYGQNNAPNTQLPILEVGLLNAEQEDAVTKGLTEPLSVVTGPPGTGKTQVVTALVASAVYNNETVLFASNNNKPVDGVYNRLGQSAGSIGNWLMRLGNLDKRRECYGTISSLLERIEIENLEGLSLDKDVDNLTSIEQEIVKANVSLDKARLLQKSVTKLHNKENAIEQKLPQNWREQFADIDPGSFDQTILKKLKKHSSSGFWLWLRRKFFDLEKFKNKHNALLTKLCEDNQDLSEYESFLLLDESWDEAIDEAQQTARYMQQHQNWATCIQRRRRLEQKITQHSTLSDIFDLKSKKSKVSQIVFEKWWLDNIRDNTKDATESFKNYFKDIDDYGPGRHRRLKKSLNALKRFFPIWITTNQSTSAIMPPLESLFDLVVIDEAGQCDIPSIIPLLYRAKRAVIIGDPEQLQHITSLKDELEHTLVKKLELEDIADEWSFTRRSAFDRSFSSTQCTSFLKQHYRCHPDIIEFSNLSFYDGKLVEQVALSRLQNQLPIEENGLIWHNTFGKALKAKSGAWNPAEIKKTVETFERWAERELFSMPNLTYGVITPFRKQANEMRQALSKCSWYEPVASRFTIGTVHSLQGSECDVLVYSPVVAEGMENYLVKFAASQKDLINVTVTRAKNLLYIIGDLQACQNAQADTPLHQLAAYAEKLRKQKQYPLNEAEKAMSRTLDELKMSYTPQYILGQYRLDFLLNAPSGDRYDLEVDGDIHLTADAVKHDEVRDAFVGSKGFKILRFAARDVMHKPELIKERLMRV